MAGFALSFLGPFLVVPLVLSFVVWLLRGVFRASQHTDDGPVLLSTGPCSAEAIRKFTAPVASDFCRRERIHHQCRVHLTIRSMSKSRFHICDACSEVARPRFETHS